MDPNIKTAQAAKKTDFDLLKDVTCELAWIAQILPTDIGIQVKDGIVTLSGVIDSWPRRRAAQEAAHHVAGVLDVANNLDVRLPGCADRADSEIARVVRQALEWDELAPHRHIRTTVTHGFVTLEGVVATSDQRMAAERTVKRLTGVRRVDNQLAVEAGEACAAADLPQPSWWTRRRPP
jgi:osmotically-inducible protein OsmY